ncbi:flavin reductase (NADPH) [Biomphalaria pfeifferi]|uniref:Flavin reductase (NADPH) n=1 Tax=Biomphalaria pfeifferi TaxID=112525 RepID=A0AAD8BRP6_BIOPF|nr:flavin reductase (NADPH) [Biomphalaria pfeifferi]
MKILVIGATGPTGLLIISEALARGYDVIALIRSPVKMTMMHPKLKVVQADILKSEYVVQADILKSEDVAKNLKGCDAVLSAVGSRAGMMSHCDVYSKSGEAVVNAMRQTGVKRFIAITSWATKDSSDVPFIWRWVVKPVFLFFMKNVLNDMKILEDYLQKECSDIDYTVVKPPSLTNNTSKGNKIIAKEGQYISSGQSAISRQDVAKFMLDHITHQGSFQKLISVAISNEKN